MLNEILFFGIFTRGASIDSIPLKCFSPPRTRGLFCHRRKNPGDLGVLAMGEASKEPCKRQACDIQACLSKNNFNSHKCRYVIEKLQVCCETCKYDSTHCASVSALLKQISKSKTS